MKIKLLKDHHNGKAGDEIDVTEERGNYLVRMGVAEESFIDNSHVNDPDPEKEEIEPEKEKKEFKPAKEKKVHTSLPTAKKRGRKPK